MVTLTSTGTSFPRRAGDMNGHGLKGRGLVWWVPWEEMSATTYLPTEHEAQLLIHLLRKQLSLV